MAEPEDASSLERSIDMFHRAKAGDPSALNALLARYHPRLMAWASGRLPSKARHLMETTDIVQKALTGFLRNIETFEPRHDGAVLAYMRTVIYNEIKTAARTANRHPGGADPEDLDRGGKDGGGLSPLEMAISSNVVSRYELALERISESERTGVILHVEFGYSWDQLAEVLGKSSPDAARMFVNRAKKKVAKEMGDVRP